MAALLAMGCGSGTLPSVSHTEEGLLSCTIVDTASYTATSMSASGRYITWGVNTNPSGSGTWGLEWDNTRTTSMDDIGAAGQFSTNSTLYYLPQLNRTNPLQMIYTENDPAPYNTPSIHFRTAPSFYGTPAFDLAIASGLGTTGPGRYNLVQPYAAIDGDFISLVEHYTLSGTPIVAQYRLAIYQISMGYEVASLTSSYQFDHPAQYNDATVYEDYAADSTHATAEIWVYFESTGTKTRVATYPASLPDIEGDRIVYSKPDSSGVDQIWHYKISTGVTTQLSSGSGHKTSPKVSGDKVVWETDVNGNWDVYGYGFDISAVRSIATGAGDQLNADVSNGMVAFTTPYGSNRIPVTYTFWDTHCSF